MPRPVKLAYLVNQGPQPSHSFIRREILAHEAAGVAVDRYTVRRYAGTLADPTDRAERDKTRVLLDGVPALIAATLKTAVAAPAKFWAAAKLAARNARTADRGGLLLHLVYLAEACVLRQKLVADPVDHVHAHFGTNSTTVAMLCRTLGGPPYSFTVHGPEEYDRARNEGLALRDKVARSAFAVTISEFGRGQLMRWTNSDDWPRVVVVRCGIDAAFLDAPPVPTPKNRRVVCVGRLVEQKAQLLLVQAAALMRDRGTAVEVRVIGEGKLRPQIEAMIARLNVAGHVTLLGTRSAAEVRQEMLDARVVTQPSLAEGLPVAVMEAMALRRAVVATRIAAVPELVDDACGWVIPAGSVERLADALTQALAADDERLDAMGEEGRRRVVERHRAADQAAVLRAAIDRHG